MARDPLVALTDVQWVLGHAQLSTTQIYLTPMPGDVIAGMLAHHRRSDQTGEQTGEQTGAAEPVCVGPVCVGPGAPGVGLNGYRRDTLDVLFEGRSR